MIKKIGISIVCLFFSFLQLTFGQKPKELVQEYAPSSYDKVDLLSAVGRSNIEVSREVSNYELFNINKKNIADLYYNSPDNIKFSIPSKKRTNLNLLLVEVQLPLMEVEAAPSGKKIKYRTGKHYRGIIEGQEGSLAAISIYEDEIYGLVSEERSESSYVIGKIKGDDTHIFYNDGDLLEKENFSCGTSDSNLPKLKSEDILSSSLGTYRSSDKCVKLYFELDYDIFLGKGGETGAVNYITAVYNQMATLYANEQITTSISKILVWTETSPYTGSSTSTLLNQFGTTRTTFEGDLGMLVGYKGNGGVAYVNGLCAFQKRFSMGYSAIGSTFSNVPTYSWTVNLLTHEFGHLFGSPHTHACAWNGNDTPIDGCAAPEGSCARPGNPTGGGTIMSYCHNVQGVGVNFQKGFGEQPGNLMRARVAAANCIGTCAGGGGVVTPPPTTCTSNTVTFEIVTDLYPNETSWQITNSTGTILYSGGPYTNQLSKVTQTFCLPNGCYNFKINDSYGDGLCCGQGQGNYKIIFNNTTLITGGQFTSTETKQFCVQSTGQTPTCTDGIKNGNETGIDCGGSCTPCVTDPCVGNTAPTSSLTKANQSFVAGTLFAVTATASDNGSISKVEFWQGTTLLGTDNASPYEYTLNTVTAGTFVIVARAYDNCNAQTNSASRTYTATATCSDGVKNGTETGVDCGGTCTACVTDPCAGNTAPTASLTKANQSFKAGTPFSITATASDNGSISKVEFWQGATLLSTDNTSPYEYILNSVTAGTFDIIARAYDNCNAQTNSASRTYTATATCSDGVKNGTEIGVDCGGPCTACVTDPCVGNTAPTASLTKANQSFIAGTSFSITATASDNGSISKVEFWQGATLLGTDNTAPYEYTLNTVTAGTFDIIARAYDNCNAQTNSASRTYTATATCSDGVKNGTETGVDCGGSCTACQAQCTNGVLTLITDRYPNETTWSIRKLNGDVVKSGSNYTGQFTTYNIDLCLDPGTCYNFIINDAFGDGICCSQGSGSYKIVFNGTTLTNGGQFTTSQTKQFCIPSTGPPAPTCTDGIKNGNETGIDCGGSCSPCQTDPCVGNTAPVISLSKANQSFIAGTPFSITTTASDNGSITKVEFWQGATLLGTDNTSPYEYTLNSLVAGTFVIIARAFDNCNAQTNSASRTYTATATCSDGVKNGTETGVDCGGTCTACQTTNPCDGNTAPIVNLTKANQSFVAGTPFVITATASDNGSISKVEFWQGTTLLGTDNSSPFEHVLNTTAAGSYTIVARAYDNCNAQTNSSSRTYTGTATCSDGVKNGTETGVDCGGTCTACQTAACVNVKFTLVTDAYPSETSWTLKDEFGATLFSGSGYTQSFKTFEVNMCLKPLSCYTFRINDTFGDGICCSQGSGSYNFQYNGSTLTQGGSFGSSDNKTICIPATGNSFNLEESNKFIYPNPATTYLIIKDKFSSEGINGNKVNLDIFDSFGKLVKTFKTDNVDEIRIGLEELSNGQYFLRMVEKEKILLQDKFVIIR